MADVLKSIDCSMSRSILQPASRSLQESIINYSGNKNPEILTCLLRK
jgi:hypothetical protein